MTIYIALLRGINVGGKNKIKMADLQRTFETAGVSRVQTYIASGNVLFESEDGAEMLRVRLEREIANDFGISLTVVLRTAEELERVLRNCPFDADSLAEGESIHIALLTEAPSQKALDILAKCDSPNDEYRVHGQEMYFLFRQRIVDSPLGKSLQKLGDTITARNWNTISKLAELAEAMRA